MNFIKDYGAFLITLLVGLVVLKFLLGASKGLPLVGSVASKAEELID